MDVNANLDGSTGPTNYRFDCFSVNEKNRLLFKDSEEIPLTPKVLDILLVFLANPGRVLDKDELIERVWDSKFVEEGNLARNVSTLRKALGGDAHDHRYIVTVPGRGYRFVADVSEANGSVNPTVTHGKGSLFADGATPELRRKFSTRTLVFSAAPVILVLAIATLIVYYNRTNRPGIDASSIRSIAVLPLKDLSGDSSDEYISTGVTDSLTNSLAKIEGLRVISPSSAARFKSPEIDPVAIGKQLSVAAVLEGSIRKEGELIRLTVRLVSTADGQVLWVGDTNEHAIKDIFALQDETALAITSKLGIKLSPEMGKEVSRRYTENVDAYQLYLKGRYFWNKRTEDGLRKGIGYFQQAIDVDPNYALAYAGMADCFAMLNSYDMLSPDVAVPKAKEAALNAIRKDDKLAQPHCTLAYVETEHDWDWQDAESEFKTGIALNPNYATCHHWYALHLAYRGRFDESLSEIGQARQLDPLSLIINSNIGRILYFARQYDAAIVQLQTTVELDESFGGAHYKLAEVYATTGRGQEAITEYAKSMELEGDKELAGVLQKTYTDSGYKAARQAWLDKARERSTRGRVSPYEFAVQYADLGDPDHALTWLEKAAAERSSWIVLIKSDPKFDKLKGDSRYEALLKRIGI